MKIAVLSYPRTGSTKLCSVLRNSFELHNYNEPLDGGIFSSISSNFKKIQDIDTYSNCIIKFHSVHFFGLDLHSINWKMFDLICATYRNNLVDAFISESIAFTRNNWIKMPNDTWDIRPFVVDLSIIHVCKWYEFNVVKFKLMLLLIQQYMPVFKFEYSEINNHLLLVKKMKEYHLPINNLGEVPSVPTGINYKEKCLNYDKVEEKFKELGYIT